MEFASPRRVAKAGPESAATVGNSWSVLQVNAVVPDGLSPGGTITLQAVIWFFKPLFIFRQRTLTLPKGVSALLVSLAVIRG